MFVLAQLLQSMIIFFNIAFQILYWLLIARIILSWFPVDPYNNVMQMLYQTTEPILAPFRRMPLRIGLIDLTPIVAFVTLSFVRNILIGILLALYQKTGGSPAF